MSQYSDDIEKYIMRFDNAELFAKCMRVLDSAERSAINDIENNFNVIVIDSKVIGDAPYSIAEKGYASEITVILKLDEDDFNKILNKEMVVREGDNRDICITDTKRFARAQLIGNITLKFVKMKYPSLYDLSFVQERPRFLSEIEYIELYEKVKQKKGETWLRLVCLNF